MPSVEQVVRQYRQRVEQELNTSVQVILFGSHARGDATPDSDVDVLVILPEWRASLVEKLIDIAWQVSLEQEIVLSVTPLAAEQLPLMQASPFFRAVQQEGIPV